jgi:hypothetical protein
LKKTRLNEVERKKKQDEKAKEKTEKGKEKTEKGNDKKTNVQDEITSIVLDEVCSLSLHPTEAPSGTLLISLPPKSVLS